jgi:hypothetical protein
MTTTAPSDVMETARVSTVLAGYQTNGKDMRRTPDSSGPVVEVLA